MTIETPTCATAAALEVLLALSSYTYSLAHVTHEPPVARLLMDVIGCRSVELLEVYIRRVVEHIIDQEPDEWIKVSNIKFTVNDALSLQKEKLIERMREEEPALLASQLRKCNGLLGRFLKGEMFTEAQLEELLRLKELRNLIVHNNGVVDTRYARATANAQVGQRLDFSVQVLHAVTAAFRSVQHIDSLLVARYPVLGQEPGAEFQATLMRQTMGSFSELNATPEELGQFGKLQTALAEMNLPFPPPQLPTGFDTVWMIEEHGTQWMARSIDGRVILPFGSEAEAQSWIELGDIDWDGSQIVAVEDGWATIQLTNGTGLKWPENMVPRE